jgi:tetratricopeptide (TPR) repeat protein
MKKWPLIFCFVFAASVPGFASGQGASATPVATKAPRTTSAPKTTSPEDTHSVPGKTETKVSAPKEIDDTLSTYMSLAWKIFLAFALPMAGWLFIKEWRRDPLVIEPLDLPKDLQDLGLSGVVMSQLLSDHVFELQRNARFDDELSDLIFVELPKMQLDLQLPGMAWSLRALVRYLKQAFGKQERRLIGEVVRKRTFFSIRLRLTSGRASDVPVTFHNMSDLDSALKSAAEVAITLINPFEAASINYFRESIETGYSNTIRSIQLYLSTAPASTHQEAYVLWANVCRTSGDPAGMEEKLRLAEMAGANVADGFTVGRLGVRYRNLQGGLYRERLDFSLAEATYIEALRASPKDLPAMSNLGLLYHDMWRLDDAEFWFRHIVRSRPNSSRGYRGLGLAAARAGKVDSALRFFSRAIDLAPFARWPRINQMETLRRKGDYVGALKAIEDFQHIDARFPPLFRFWGELLLDMNELDKAVKKYRESIRLNPFDPWTYVSYSRALRRMGRLVESSDSISKALALRPNLPSAIIFKSEKLIREGNIKNGLDLLFELTRTASHDPWVHSRLVDELRRQGQLAKAKEVLAGMPEHCKGSTEGLRASAWVHIEENELTLALEKFRLAVTAAPYEPWNYLGIANIFRRERKFDEALTAVKGVIEIHPLYLDAHIQHGRILADRGDIAGATERYRDAVRIAPQDVSGYLMLADALRRQSKYGEALAAIDDALKIWPDMPDALRSRGDILQGSGDVDGALHQYEEAVRVAPHDPASHLALADFHRLQKNFEKSITAVEVAMRLRPDMADALRLHGDILRDRGDQDDAMQKYWEASRLAPHDPWLQFKLADLLRQQKKFDDAITAVERALTLSPAFPEALRLYGDILRDHGDLDGAMQKYREAARTVPGEPWPHVAMARLFQRQKKADEAIVLIDEALRLRPNTPNALRLYGDILHDRGDQDGALQKYQEAVRADPDYSWAHYSLANLLWRQGKDEEAIASLEETLRLRPEMPEALGLYGDILRDRDDLDGAMQKYREAAWSAPREPWPHLAMARLLRRQGKTDEAIVLIDDALRLRPNTPDALQLYGDILHDRGDQDGALQKYQEAVRADPDYSWAHYSMANLLWRQGKDEEAIASLEETLRLRPEMPEALGLYGDILCDREDLDSALQKYREAARAVPEEPWPHLAMARLLRRQGKADEAIMSIDEALRLQPDMAEALGLYGDILRDRDDLNNALQKYQEAVRADPDYSWAHYSLASLLRRQGKDEEAIASLEEALRLQPDMAEAFGLYGDILHDRGDQDGALQKYQEAVRADPDYSWAHYSLASLLWRQGKDEEAIASLEEALRLQPDMPEALQLYGAILLHSGDQDGALQKYLEAVRGAPNNPWPHLAIAHLLRRQNRLPDALAAVEAALRFRPEMPEALRLRNDILHDIDNLSGQ